ncbi:GNAT family N-acetyltransferase [Mycobacteroides franklinii]|uniref:GNAT family N-acetyltransferase n=1 Tax=Mycobacteroides franklinii TaxID=948102 RepID=A0A4R5PCL9_9MYCO|nr:GNAT family N-acetyltransferase [Mycobacteroides franklinii]ORA63137.1 GNAT family N-acetyltransferase [Mycobacteroides franklinii]TDH22553.1 GNAT family N-acetyltransferase [Mycobacteroides franklinii]
MSELTLRTIADEDDYESYLSFAYSVFLQDPQKDEMEASRKFTELDRMIGFHNGGKWVATAGAYSRHVVLPGGAVVPVAAITAVTVSPTHRRRGLLTTMMRHQLADIRSRGEAIAMLYASEALIYGRFGYGVATEAAELSGQVRELAFRSTVDLGDGTLEEVDAETFLASAPAVYDAAVSALPGQMSRTPEWWAMWTLDNEERQKESGKIRFVLHYESDGTVSGFAIYRPKPGWGDAGPNAELHVQEVLGTNPRAYARTWRYLLDMDLVRKIKYHGASVHEELRYLVANHPSLECTVSDAIQVRLVDIARALSQRRYAADVDVVLEVTDEFLPENSGRYRLRGGLDDARCEITTDDADIALSVRDLGSVYMGGVSLQALASAGLVTELRTGAVQRAAIAFGWPVAPSAPDDF